MRRILSALPFLLAAACDAGPAPDAAFARARTLAREGTLDAALVDLRALAERHPGDARVALLAAQVATWRDAPREALDWTVRAAAAAPHDPEPHLRAAYLLLVHPPGGEPDAAAALEQAEAARADAGGKESADYLACRGEAAFVLGDDVGAERWFRAALSAEPRCRRALHRLLQIKAARGADDRESASLRARLDALLGGGHMGHGMENARVPATFCGG